MQVNGWGRYPLVSAEFLEPADSNSLKRMITSKKTGSMIPRGAGRSYGDSSLADKIISSRFLDNFLDLNENTENELTLRCGAGVSLDDILKVCIPRGWFLPVLPGTKFVTVGGAIAADIHGKNHHKDGSFCEYVESLSLLLASGEAVSCSAQEKRDLFRATCGGMGLTGIIVDARIRLRKVPSASINQKTVIAHNLQQCLELLEENNNSTYSVAWLDCLARGKDLGRSLIFLGEHEKETTKNGLSHKSRRIISVPFSTPSFLLNKFTMGAFNKTYFNIKRRGRHSVSIDYDRYFFPLDNIGNWNRLYGSRGFLQYQFVIPGDAALAGITKVLSRVSDAGKGSFLSVLKKFGAENKNMLSFPKDGYTLTLDFKREDRLFPLLLELDEIVVGHGGRIYLAKDARMNEAVFKAGYPNWENFLRIKQEYDPKGVFSSHQSIRLGLS